MAHLQFVCNWVHNYRENKLLVIGSPWQGEEENIIKTPKKSNLCCFHQYSRSFPGREMSNVHVKNVKNHWRGLDARGVSQTPSPSARTTHALRTKGPARGLPRAKLRAKPPSEAGNLQRFLRIRMPWLILFFLLCSAPVRNSNRGSFSTEKSFEGLLRSPHSRIVPRSAVEQQLMGYNNCLKKLHKIM